MENRASTFEKHGDSPVFGNRETGTMFDAYVWKQNGRLRMDVSWRPKKALAVTFSDDGVHWDEPVITLECDPSSGWENNINRHCVMPDPNGSGYLMWYTGQWWEQDKGRSWPALRTVSILSGFRRIQFSRRKRILKANL